MKSEIILSFLNFGKEIIRGQHYVGGTNLQTQSTFSNEDTSLVLSTFISRVITKHDMGMLDNDVHTHSTQTNGRLHQKLVLH